MVFLWCRGCARKGCKILTKSNINLLKDLLKWRDTKFIQTVITQCKLKNSRMIIIVFHVNLTEMRYFTKSVLTTPFCICLDWVGTILRTEDYTYRYINYPLNFLSPGPGVGWGSAGSGSFLTFQKMYLKQAKGPAKQWCSIKHHGVNITTPPPPPLSLMVG